MRNHNPFVIISAEVPYVSNIDNDARTRGLIESLRTLGVQYSQVEGWYNNVGEVSFMVPVPSNHGDTMESLIELARHYNQESVLFVGADRYGILYFTDDSTPKGLGIFRKVSAEVAKVEECWTKMDNGDYYTCVSK